MKTLIYFNQKRKIFFVALFIIFFNRSKVGKLKISTDSFVKERMVPPCDVRSDQDVKKAYNDGRNCQLTLKLLLAKSSLFAPPSTSNSGAE
jgi:hypothetical protein